MSLPVLPSLIGLGWPVRRSPQWGGTKADALSGKRVRTTWRTAPTYAYQVPYNVLKVASDYPTLQGFINALNGPVGVFLFSDPNDNAVTAQNFGAGDGTSTTFQLVRTFGSFTEPVFFPVSPLTTVTVAGVSTSAYTLNNYGTVTFTSAPANGAALAWTGSFYWGCRFDDDNYDFENFMSSLVRLKALKFSTEKFP